MTLEEKKSKGLDIDWKITIPADEINAKINEEIVKIIKTLSLPGFRPGKVPFNIAKQKYIGSITQKVLDEAINSNLKKNILDKNFILEKIRKVEGKTLDGKFINFSFLEKENKINLFFSKSNYDLVGWQSIDIYQNLSITFISSIIKNIEIDENLFKLPIQD